MSLNQALPVILVVDDDEAVRNTIQTYAQQAGYEVLLAADGKEAMSAAAAKCPDLLITDIFMPQMDGLEVIQCFRRMFPATRIIAVSEIQNAHYLKTAQHLGAHVALEKPLQQDKLLQAIARQIDGKQA